MEINGDYWRLSGSWDDPLISINGDYSGSWSYPLISINLHQRLMDKKIVSINLPFAACCKKMFQEWRIVSCTKIHKFKTTYSWLKRGTKYTNKYNIYMILVCRFEIIWTISNNLHVWYTTAILEIFQTGNYSNLSTNPFTKEYI